MSQINEWALNPTPAESAWIKYQLELAGIKSRDVAETTSTGVGDVSNVLAGRRHSKKIEKEIATLCGYPSWNDMLRSLRGENVA